MKKRTIIYIACAVAVALIIAFAIYFSLKANSNKPKIIIEKYDTNFNVEKTIEITDKNQIKEFNKFCDNISLDQDDISKSLGIKKDVKVDFGNGKLFFMQLDLPVNYCYYEDENTKLVIKMPEGLLNKINETLNQN